jgi:NDP-sugar pyrophosphorylase family protein
LSESTVPAKNAEFVIDAAILVGGLGTRLRPVLSDRPKPLAPVNGRPFIAFLLDQLAGANLGYVILCTGYGADQMRSTLGDSYRSLEIVYSQEPDTLGTAGALRFAASRFRSDTVLVLNGDSYCNVDLMAFSDWHRQHQGVASIVLTEVRQADRFGSVDTAPDGRIVKFGEKVTSPASGWVNAGIYLIARQLIEEIPPDRAISLEREVFPAWIGRGFYGYLHRGVFLDIGTPESYAQAAQLFATKDTS